MEVIDDFLERYQYQWSGLEGEGEVWKVARVKTPFSRNCSEKELKGALGLRDFFSFFKIKGARTCLYGDRNDLVEREKMIQKREVFLEGVKFLRTPEGWD